MAVQYAGHIMQISAIIMFFPHKLATTKSLNVNETRIPCNVNTIILLADKLDPTIRILTQQTL